MVTGSIQICITRNIGINSVMASESEISKILEDFLCVRNVSNIIDCLVRNSIWQRKIPVNKYSKREIKEFLKYDTKRQSFINKLDNYGLLVYITCSNSIENLEEEQTRVSISSENGVGAILSPVISSTTCNDDILALKDFTIKMIEKRNLELALDLIRLLQKYIPDNE